MSDVQATPAAIAVPVTETVPTPVGETAPVITASEAPAAAKADEPVVAPVETAPGAIAAAEAAPTAVAAEEAKSVEPVNEGLLGYKAPGLLKQFTFAKKDFWFGDEAVAPEHLSSYLRGEKAEISHPVVAYASQTGKGLLFFAKKGDSDKTKPAGVLPLYEATDLKKTSQLEFTFRLHNQSHSFKASSEDERDGWYQSIEKSIELGKAQKETVVESEAYKAELQKLGTPAGGAVAATVAAAGAGAAGAAVVASRKSTDIDRAEGVKPTSDDDEDVKKTKKSRSTSRGLVARLRGKKEELEAKIEENIKEHEAAIEEKKVEREEQKAAEAAAAEEATETGAAVDERPKPSKRGSIFGSLVSGFKTPSKEKDAKEAELKQEGVADVAPQLPETAAAPAIVEPVEPVAPVTEAPVVAAAEPETKATEEAVITPSREKKNFLSGFGFNKRDRSVSPSAAAKETPVVTEPAVATEPVVAAEPAVEPTTAVASTEPEVAKEEEAAPANKRQSVFGGLGRRASKMISRISSSKDVNSAETKAEGATETSAIPAVAESDLAAHEATEPVAAATETKPVETENKPEVIATPFGTSVTASA